MRTLSRFSLFAILAVARSAAADAPTGQPQRDILGTHQQSGVPDKQIVLGTSSLAPETAIGFHTHPGDEIGYVRKGTLILKIRGHPDRILKAGDTFFNARGAVHSLVAAPGGDGGIAVSTWTIDKDQPLATPAP